MTDTDTMLYHYSDALDAIFLWRCAAVYEARVIETYLDYRTVPKALRIRAADQVKRLRAGARGQTALAYADVSASLMKGLLSRAGAAQTLSRAGWELDRGTPRGMPPPTRHAATALRELATEGWELLRDPRGPS